MKHRRITNYFVTLTVDDENRIVSKVYDPRVYQFDITDVTGDVKGAVHLLRMGVPVKCVRDEGFLSDIEALYAEVIAS